MGLSPVRRVGVVCQSGEGGGGCVNHLARIPAPVAPAGLLVFALRPWENIYI